MLERIRNTSTKDHEESFGTVPTLASNLLDFFVSIDGEIPDLHKVLRKTRTISYFDHTSSGDEKGRDFSRN